MSADEKTTTREKKVINLMITSFETGVENEVRYTRIRGPYGRSTLPVKVKGSMSAALNARLNATLSEGETIEGKKLFVELTGEFQTFTNDEGKRFRFFSADKFELVMGPALELARMRREAAAVLENAEIMRKAGRIDQAYKMVTTTFAEFAHVALDLSDFDDEHLLGAISEPPVNAEKAALAQLDREETCAPTTAPSQPDDDIVLEADAADLPEQDAAAPLEFGGEDTQDRQAEDNEPTAAIDFNHDHEGEDNSYDDVLDGDVDQNDDFSFVGNDLDAEDAQDDVVDENEQEEPDDHVDTPAPAPSPAFRVAGSRFGRRF